MAALGVALAVLLLPAASAWATEPCSSAANDIISPSCFEGGDGNLTVDNALGTGRIDWSSLPSVTTFADGTGPSDDEFGGGSQGKENDPGHWLLTTGSNQPKADVVAVATKTDPVTNKLFFYGAFKRVGSTGAANLSFELNQDNTLWDNDGNSSTRDVPTRTDGDLLITFDTNQQGNPNNVRVGMCKWHGDKYGESSTDPNHAAFGWYTLPGYGLGGVKIDSNTDCTVLSQQLLADRKAFGNMNADDLPNAGVLPSFPNPIPANTFGEMSVNLSDALALPGDPNPCFSFGGIWLHTRSSDVVNSQMGDYVAPSSLLNASSCKISVDKKVAVEPPGGPVGSYHDGTLADPSYANNGDTLHYSLAITNDGANTVAIDSVTDLQCDSAPTIADADKLNSSLAPDATPTSFDAGDIWTYRCSHVLAAGDAEPFVNTVTVKGHVGTTPRKDLEATDSATTGRYGKVIIEKQAVGGNDTFTFTPNASLRTSSTASPALNGSNQFTLQDDGQQQFVNVLPDADGAYTVAESALTGWKLTEIACDDGDSTDAGPTPGGLASSTATIKVSAGETVHCIFTNTKDATIEIEKDAIGGAASDAFTFTPDANLSGSTFDLKDGETQSFTGVLPGTYSMSESVPSGWRLTQIVCNDTDSTSTAATPGGLASSSASIVVAAGETVHCVFTNVKDATIVVEKQAVGGAADDEFTFTPDADLSGDTFNLKDGGTKTFANVVPGSYDMSESVPTGWRLTQIACDDGDSTDAGPDAQGVSSTATIAVAAGESVHCTFTNTKDARIVVEKQAVGGAGTEEFTFTPDSDLSASTFNLQDGGSKTFDNVVPGSYSMAESVPGGWRLTQIACDDGNSTDAGPDAAGLASSTATIDVSAGESVHCTFTNVKDASIVVEKQAVGGSADDEFTFTPDAALSGSTFNLKDGQSKSFGNVVPGSYSMAESVPADWRLTEISCDDGDSTDAGPTAGGLASSAATIDVSAGESVHCVFTNVKDATIVVEKQAVGGAADDEFTFTPDADLSGDTFNLKDGGTKTFANVVPGSYDMSESVPADWRLTQIACNDGDSTNVGPTPAGLGSSSASIVLAAGESVHCVFTNVKDASIIVEKQAVGGAADDEFTFTPDADLSGDTFNLKDGGTKTFANVVPGSYDMSESVPAGWRLTQVSCDDGNSTDAGPDAAGLASSAASIDVSAGESVHCVFTNVKDATIVIEKDAVGGAADDEFTFTPDQALSGDTFNLKDGQSKSFANVVPGSYDMSESVPADWRLTQIACDDGNSTDAGPDAAGLASSAATIDVSAGETVHCTFTNVKDATIVVAKEAVGGDGTEEFAFTPDSDLSGSTFNLKDGQSKSFGNVVPGSYSMAESVPADWRLTEIACDDGNSTDAGPTAGGLGSSTATIDVSAGETVHCTFTNVKDATIVVEKQAVGGDGSEEFTFTPDADLSGSTFNLKDGGTKSFGNVVPGSYSMAESVPADWRLTQIACDDGDSTDAGPTAGGLASSTATIDVSAGETVHCTFTNVKDATIVVEKQAVGGSADDEFTFTPDADLSGDTFNLKDGGTKTFSNVVPGSYSMSESVPAGWRLTQIACDDGNSTDAGPDAGGLASSEASIDVSAGETVHCVFTNTKNAAIVIEKDAVGGAADDEFTFTPDQALSGDTFKLKDGGTETFNDVVPGSYDVSESVPADWRLTQIACDDGNSTDAGPDAAGLASSTATIDVSAGETVHCTFTNVKDATIVVEKQAVGGSADDEFTFTPDGALSPDTFKLKDNGTKTFANVVPGAYSMAESVPAGWRLTEIACDDGNSTDAGPDAQGVSSTASIDVSAGETVHCTFTNTKDATIEVEKQAVGGSADDEFTFTPDADLSGSTFNLKDGGIKTFANVVPGSYSMAESVPSHWRLTQIACDDDNSTDAGPTATGLGSSEATIAVSPGEVVRCVFTNVKDARVEVVKTTSPAGVDRDFAFTATGTLADELGDSFKLNDGADETDSVTAFVRPGTFAVAEADATGWRLDSVQCTGADSSAIENGRSVTATAGQTVTCEFVNQQLAHITVTKQTDPDGDPAVFEFTGLGSFSLSDGQSKAAYVDPGEVTLDESVPGGWDVGAIECTGDQNAGQPDLAAGSIVLHADAAEDIACTFRNVKRGAIEVTKTEAGSSTLTQVWTFHLTGGPDQVDITKTTENGNVVTFGNLKPGVYTLCEVGVPEGWVSSINPGDASGGTFCEDVTLDAGATKQVVVDNSMPITVVAKDGDELVHAGDTITYTFDVSNDGNVALHDVVLDDARCESAITRDATHDKNADGDAFLENPGEDGQASEVWRFTCTYTVPADHKIGDENPVVNTVTVTAKAPDGTVVTDTDTHSTTVLHPAIAVDKQVRRAGEGQYGDAPVQAKIGDTLEYRFKVTNPGDTGLSVQFADPRCDAGSLSDPAKSGGNDDGTLDPGETWTYTCSHKITAQDPNPFENTVTVTGTDELGGDKGTVTGTDSTSNPVIHPAIALDKTIRVGGSGDYVQGPVDAHVGDTLGYRFAVTNPGDVPLTDVTLADPRCDSGTLSGPAKAGGDDDAALEPGETWTYTCTHTLTADDPRPFENTATATGTDPLGGKPSATDSASANSSLWQPAVAIDKTGPATAAAGSRVGYTLWVTNPGPVALIGETVAVTDPLCEAPPALQGKTRDGVNDASPDTLDPGDLWIYTCTVQTTADQSRVDNVATVTASDGHTTVTASDTQATTLERQATLPEQEQATPSSARLSSPSGCRPRAFTARVRGTGIKQVTFYIDGKLVKRLKASSARKLKRTRSNGGATQEFPVRINPAKYKNGTHRLTAKIQFVASARRKSRKLLATFQRCEQQVIAPRFTG